VSITCRARETIRAEAKMRKIPLSATQRTEVGKGPARRLRASGKIPAIFYGKKIDPIKLSVDRHDFTKLYQQEGRNAVYELRVPDNGGSSNRTAILKERQTNPLDGGIIHLDFIEVFMDETIEVSVALEFVGKSVGEERGGIVQAAARSVRVSCLPNDIPELIEVDVSQLDIGDSVHVADLKLPEAVTAIDDETMTVVTVVTPKRVEIEAPLEGEEGVEEPAEEAAEGAAETAEKSETAEGA
jgi:large subunit ribosomal protein L25